MARSDSRLYVEFTLPIGFTALLAAAAVVVAARGVLTAGDALGLMVAVVVVVCWVGRPLAAVPVAVMAWMFFLTFAERPVDELRIHGPADWWRLAGAAASAAAARARRLRRHWVPREEDVAAADSQLWAADAEGVTRCQEVGTAVGMSGRGGAGRPPTPVSGLCRRQPRRADGRAWSSRRRSAGTRPARKKGKGALVVDLIYVVLTVAVFVLLALILRAVERL